MMNEWSELVKDDINKGSVDQNMTNLSYSFSHPEDTLPYDLKIM